MKISTLRSGLAMACALSLAACGGSDNGDLQVGGSIGGNTSGSTVLQNNGGNNLTVAAGINSFYFNNVGVDANYDITVLTPPPNSTCNVINGKGKTGAYSVNSVIVQCNLIQHELSGTVNKLRGEGLVVINGSQRVAIPAGATTFSMTTTDASGNKTGTVGETQTYGLQILTQPAGQTCTIVRGSGRMETQNISNIVIEC
jgi:hypothetical protein